MADSGSVGLLAQRLQDQQREVRARLAALQDELRPVGDIAGQQFGEHAQRRQPITRDEHSALRDPASTAAEAQRRRAARGSPTGAMPGAR